MKGIEIIPCGTIVCTVIGKKEGQITGVNIRFDRVQYEVSYYNFNSGEISTIWMNESEFISMNTTKQKIGYK